LDASGTSTVAVQATDASGNSQTKTYSVDSGSAPTQTPTYDVNGNVLFDGSRTYEWDAADQLVAINNGTQRSEFTYDGVGRRVRIVEKDSATVTSDKRFLWCGTEICEERDASGATVQKRFFGQGVQDGGTNYLYATDHLGSVRELTNSSGALQTRYDYTPYGKRTKVSGTPDSDAGFTGHRQHRSGLALTMFRAYDPAQGRWLSPDPIGIAGGINLYGYVDNDPVNATDSLGLAKDSEDKYATLLCALAGLVIGSATLVIGILLLMAAMFVAPFVVAFAPAWLVTALTTLMLVLGAAQTLEAGMALAQDASRAANGDMTGNEMAFKLGMLVPTLLAMVLTGMNAGKSNTFEITDGVRRAKASQVLGRKTIRARIYDRAGNFTGERDIPVDQLRSPYKSAIDMSTQVHANRYMRVQKGFQNGDPMPPIDVVPGSNGLRLEDIIFDMLGGR
jgi:RHS repeat-associated protein